jgi:hypothetical protein
MLKHIISQETHDDLVIRRFPTKLRKKQKKKHHIWDSGVG